MKALLTMTLTMLLAASAFAFDPWFESRPEFWSGESPYSLALGDLDGDNDLDLAVAGNDDWFFLMENVGEGAYALADSFSFGNGSSCVAVGDLDGDLDIDLVVGANYDTLFVLRNDGGWNFTTTAKIATNSFMFIADIELVDLENDTDIDIVFTYRDAICVLPNNGNGTFGTLQRYPWSKAELLTSGDYDGDGYIDIGVSRTYSDRWEIWRNDDGSGLIPVFGYDMIRPKDLFTSLINNDTIPDIVVPGNHNVSVFFGVGDGTFTLDSTYAHSIGDTYYGVTAGDFNGDGKNDVAVLSYHLNVLMNTGDGTLGDTVVYQSGYDPVGLTCGMVDDDGDCDLVVGISQGRVGVLSNNGDGTFPQEPRLPFSSYVNSLCAADFDHDGYPDIAAVSSDSDELGVFCSNGDRTFEAPVYYPAVDNGYSICAVDVNHDTWEDIILADTGIFIYLNNGDGTFASYTILESYYADYTDYPQKLKIGDIDGDTHPDVVFVSRYYAHTFRGNGDGTFGAEEQISIAYSPSSVDLADIDHDGSLDLVVGDDDDPYLCIGLNDGTGHFPTILSIDCGAAPMTVVAEDFDGDGWADIAYGSNDGYNQVSFIFNNGDSTFTAPQTHWSAYYYIYSLITGDFDNDSDIDLVMTSPNGCSAAIWENLGGGVFLHSVDYGAGDYPYQAVAADFDADGRLDIATANYDGADISLLWNGGQFPTAVGDDKSAALPEQFSLLPNYPNPFNPSTTISYTLPVQSRVRLAVYNVLGQEVAVLVDREQAAGPYSVEWRGETSGGRPVASGIYFYRLATEQQTFTRKMVLLK